MTLDPDAFYVAQKRDDIHGGILVIEGPMLFAAAIDRAQELDPDYSRRIHAWEGRNIEQYQRAHLGVPLG